MNVFETIEQVRGEVKRWRAQGLSVGFVPTMGYLHQGHQSLIECARRENDRVAVSIFVNPIQFGPEEDYERYPVDIPRDLEACTQGGADLVFIPSVTQMLPRTPLVFVDVEELGDGLCGASRPGHFRGVCTIVSKLFHIVQPTRAYFGQKDAQQLAIIRRMSEDLNFDTQVVACPIVREPDGLAMSSRNSYLSQGERTAALCLSKGLAAAQALFAQGERSAQVLSRAVQEVIASEALARVDYVAVVDAATLCPVETLTRDALIALAVFIGKTRLIDNCTLEGGQP